MPQKRDSVKILWNLDKDFGSNTVDKLILQTYIHTYCTCVPTHRHYINNMSPRMEAEYKYTMQKFPCWWLWVQGHWPLFERRSWLVDERGGIAAAIALIISDDSGPLFLAQLQLVWNTGTHTWDKYLKYFTLTFKECCTTQVTTELTSM